MELAWMTAKRPASEAPTALSTIGLGTWSHCACPRTCLPTALLPPQARCHTVGAASPDVPLQGSRLPAVIRVPLCTSQAALPSVSGTGPCSEADANMLAGELVGVVSFSCRVTSLICPSVQQLAWLFLGLKVGKAAGPDRLPPELVAAAALQIALLVHPILVAALQQGREPLQWSGGLLAPLPKAKVAGVPDVRCCRPITISDSLAKGWHLWVRALLLDKVAQFAHTTQCGGLLGRGTHFASHVIRCFCTMVAAAGESCAVLFADLVAAFDSVVRELLMAGRLEPEALRRRLASLPLDPDVVEAILAYVAAGDLLQRANVPEEVADLVRVVHNSTWFTSRGCRSLVLTAGGTRAGNPLADLLFNLVAAGLFRVVRGRLDSAGLATQLCLVAPVDCLLPPAAGADSQTFADVSYLDDAAFALRRQHAAEILSDLPRVVACVVGSCREFGFQVNFKPGKTEAIMVLSGPLSRRLRRQVYVDQKAVIQCQCAGSDVALRIVPAYAHLGGMAASDGSLAPEFANRAAQANAAYAALSKQVFARKDLPQDTKLKAAQAFVDSRLLHNAATWHRPRSFAPLEAVRRKVAARIVGTTVADHVADKALWAVVGTLPVAEVVRYRRLRYLPALLTVAPQELLALIASCASASASWAQLVLQDLRWLRTAHVSFHGLPLLDAEPRPEQVRSWTQFVVADPGRWSRRVRLVFQDDVARLRAEVFAVSEDPLGDARLAAGLQRHLLSSLAPGEDPDDLLTIQELGERHEHKCGECGRLFPSARLLGVHRRAHHGILSEARLYAIGSRCRICQTEFHSLPRLVRHLQRHRSCLEQWRVLHGPLAPDDVAAAARAVAAARRDARRQGTPFLAAFLPAHRV